MRLVKRDIKIIKDLACFGFILTSQAAKLYGMNLKVAQRRLRKLCSADYLRKINLATTKQGRSPSLYYLGEKGASYLGIAVSKPRQTLATTHSIANNSHLISVSRAFVNHDDITCKLLPEHLMRQTQQEIIPDGAFSLSRVEKSALFLFENCAGTEIIKSPSCHDDIENKIISYIEMYKENKVEFYNKLLQKEFNHFRILYVTNNQYSRFLAIKDLIREHDQEGFIWLAMMKDFEKDFTGNIWHISTDSIKHSIIGKQPCQK